MKHILFLIFFSASSLSLVAQCTVDKFCLSFANANVVMGGSHFEFDLVVSSNSDFGLGTSNLQFKYNNAALSNPIIVSSTIMAPTYQAPSITTPFIPSLGVMVGSFNLELNSQGTGINIPTTGVTVCRLRFTVTSPTMNSDLSWYYNGGTAQTIVYDHNESTQLCAVDPGVACLEPSSSILPLDLVALKSTAQEKSILLEWKTENELNSSHFEIERSLDGLQFGSIGKVSAVNDISGDSYSFDDTGITKGVNYFYRLRIIDLDGRFEYSKIISNRIAGNQVVFEVYPNPAMHNGSIFVKVDRPIKYNFTLVDSKSNSIINLDCNDSREIDLQSLSSGIYFYQINFDGEIKTGKLIIQ